MGGGTGSGMGILLIFRIREEYFDRMMVMFLVVLFFKVIGIYKFYERKGK